MSNPPANWYPNPDPSASGERYWDGSAWTDQTREAPTQQAVPVAPVKDPDAIWQVAGKPVKGFGGGRYKLTAQYLFFEKGSLRTDSQQVPIAQVLDVDVVQSILGELRDAGILSDDEFAAKKADILARM